MYVHRPMYVDMNIAYVDMFLYNYERLSVCMCVCMCACFYVHVCVGMHIVCIPGCPSMKSLS